MLRLYLDEDAARGVLVRALRRTQLDLVTVAEASMRGKTDEQQLAFASERGLALFSFNVGDYMRLHGRWLLTERTHSDIILTSQENFGIGELQHRLTRIATSLEPTDMVDRVEFLNAWG